MGSIILDLNDDLAAVLSEVAESPEVAVRELIVTELYRRGSISRGKGAELLGMSLLDFIAFTGQLGIPYFQYSEEELRAEIEGIEELCQKDQPSPTLAP